MSTMRYSPQSDRQSICSDEDFQAPTAIATEETRLPQLGTMDLDALQDFYQDICRRKQEVESYMIKRLEERELAAREAAERANCDLERVLEQGRIIRDKLSTNASGEAKELERDVKPRKTKLKVDVESQAQTRVRRKETKDSGPTVQSSLPDADRPGQIEEFNDATINRLRLYQDSLQATEPLYPLMNSSEDRVRLVYGLVKPKKVKFLRTTEQIMHEGVKDFAIKWAKWSATKEKDEKAQLKEMFEFWYRKWQAYDGEAISKYRRAVVVCALAELIVSSSSTT